MSVATREATRSVITFTFNLSSSAFAKPALPVTLMSTRNPWEALSYY